MMKPLMLFAGFGSSSPEGIRAWKARILEIAQRRFPGCEYRFAFTSAAARDKLKARYGIHEPGPEEALRQAAAEGWDRVWIIAMQMLDGVEHRGLYDAAGACGAVLSAPGGGSSDVVIRRPDGQSMHVRITPPLLTPERLPAVAEALQRIVHEEHPGQTVLFVGHGTTKERNGVYARLQELLAVPVQEASSSAHGTDGCRERILVGDLTTGAAQPAQELAGSSVILRPLMLTAGHHWEHQIAGRGVTSFAGTLEAAGCSVTCVRRPLLAYDAATDILLEE